MSAMEMSRLSETEKSVNVKIKITAMLICSFDVKRIIHFEFVSPKRKVN
jgi:hypothetical protein